MPSHCNSSLRLAFAGYCIDPLGFAMLLHRGDLPDLAPPLLCYVSPCSAIAALCHVPPCSAIALFSVTMLLLRITERGSTMPLPSIALFSITLLLHRLSVQCFALLSLCCAVPRISTRSLALAPQNLTTPLPRSAPVRTSPRRSCATGPSPDTDRIPATRRSGPQTAHHQTR
jgi:hypothetical protein